MYQRIYVEMPDPADPKETEQALAPHVKRLIDEIRSTHAALYAFLMLGERELNLDTESVGKRHQLAVDCYWQPQISSLDAIRKQWKGVTTRTERKDLLRKHPLFLLYDSKIEELEEALVPSMRELRYVATKDPGYTFPPDKQQELEETHTRQICFDKWVADESVNITKTFKPVENDTQKAELALHVSPTPTSPSTETA